LFDTHIIAQKPGKVKGLLQSVTKHPGAPKGATSTSAGGVASFEVTVGMTGTDRGLPTGATTSHTVSVELTFARLAGGELGELDLTLNVGNDEVKSGAGGGELGEVHRSGFVFHIHSMARLGAHVKGFWLAVTFRHTPGALVRPYYSDLFVFVNQSLGNRILTIQLRELMCEQSDSFFVAILIGGIDLTGELLKGHGCVCVFHTHMIARKPGKVKGLSHFVTKPGPVVPAYYLTSAVGQVLVDPLAHRAHIAKHQALSDGLNNGQAGDVVVDIRAAAPEPHLSGAGEGVELDGAGGVGVGGVEAEHWLFFFDTDSMARLAPEVKGLLQSVTGHPGAQYRHTTQPPPYM